MPPRFYLFVSDKELSEACQKTYKAKNEEGDRACQENRSFDIEHFHSFPQRFYFLTFKTKVCRNRDIDTNEANEYQRNLDAEFPKITGESVIARYGVFRENWNNVLGKTPETI